MQDPWCLMHDAWCNTLVDLVFVRTVYIPNLNLLPSLEVFHNTLVDLIFLRTVNIPNLSLLPCLEVAYDAWCNTLVDLILVRTVNIQNLSLLPCLEVVVIGLKDICPFHFNPIFNERYLICMNIWLKPNFSCVSKRERLVNTDWSPS